VNEHLTSPYISLGIYYVL